MLHQWSNPIQLMTLDMQVNPRVAITCLRHRLHHQVDTGAPLLFQSRSSEIMEKFMIRMQEQHLFNQAVLIKVKLSKVDTEVYKIFKIVSVIQIFFYAQIVVLGQSEAPSSSYAAPVSSGYRR